MLILKSLLSVWAFAGFFSGNLGSPTIEFNQGTEKATLKLAGQGLRVKKIAFVRVKVYDAFLYVTDPASIHREKGSALDSIAAQNRWLVALKFRRDVDEGRIVESLNESLKSNQLNGDAPGIKELFAALRAAGEVKERQSFMFSGMHSAEGDRVAFQSSKGDVTETKPVKDLSRQVLSIWFGHHDESALDDLEKDLLKAP